MDESSHSDILPASGPDASQIEIGMQVKTVDGHSIGKVKEVRADEFLLDRPLARDLWIPMASVMATEDYTANYRGPVQPTAVILSVSRAHVDAQGWRHA